MHIPANAHEQADTALQYAHARLDLALEAVEGFLYDYNLLTGFVERSSGLDRVVGYQPDEVAALADWWREQMHPQDRARLMLQYDDKMATADGYSFEYRVLHKDGHYVDVWDRAKIIRDPDGRAVRMVGITVNITARKQAEAALRASEERFRRLVEANVIGIVIAEGATITYANDAFLAIVGYSSADVDSGKLEWPAMTPPEYRHLDKHALDELIASGSCKPFEKEYIRKDGSRVPILIGGALMESEPLRWVYFVLDISERKHAELERAQLLTREQAARAEAQEAVRMRDAFLSIAAHELKNPLTALIGQAQLLERRVSQSTLTERERRGLALIGEQSQRINSMINQMLDASQLDGHQLKLSCSSVRLCDLAQRVVVEIQPTLPQHTLSFTCSDPALHVYGDADRLEQVLRNLIGNAVKYSPNGGPVLVHIEQRDAQAGISVSDQGIGIPQAALPQLFRRFYRAENAETRRISGMGVGLYVVSEIVSLHGGSVTVESVEGHGSTFTVFLPLAEA